MNREIMEYKAEVEANKVQLDNLKKNFAESIQGLDAEIEAMKKQKPNPIKDFFNKLKRICQ